MHRKTVVIQFCRVTVGGPVYPPSTGSRHPSASPAPPKVCGPSGVIIPAHRIQPEPPTRSQASSNLNFKFTYHPSESATQSILLSIIHQPGPRFAHPSLDPREGPPKGPRARNQSSSIRLALAAEGLRPIHTHHTRPYSLSLRHHQT